MIKLQHQGYGERAGGCLMIWNIMRMICVYTWRKKKYKTCEKELRLERQGARMATQQENAAREQAKLGPKGFTLLFLRHEKFGKNKICH